MKRACAIIVQSLVASLAPSSFSTLSHKRQDFRDNFTKQKCVFYLPLYLLSVILSDLRRTQWDIVISAKTSSCKVPDILEVVTSGLWPSVAFLWFLTNVSGPSSGFSKKKWTLKMRRIYGPETLFKNQRKATGGHKPKVTTSYCNPGGSLKSHTRYSCRIWIELNFSRDFSGKNLKYKISSKSVQWQASCSTRTDEHDEANSQFSQI
jgi:hypothetical protein